MTPATPRGRAFVVAQLVRIYGAAMASDLVKAADAKHRLLYPNGCPDRTCPTCSGRL